MARRCTRKLMWVTAALAFSASLTACGNHGAVAVSTSQASRSPAATPAPAQLAPAAAVADAARAYFVARDQAALAGAQPRLLADRLQAGSPAASVEPRVAAGRALVAAQQGLLHVDAVTWVGPGPVSFFRGAQPVAPASVSEGSSLLRAEVACSVTSRIRAADGTLQTLRADHVVTLVAGPAGGWLVCQDDYADPQQAQALAAAGAPAWQVRAAQQRVRALARVRRASATPFGAVRAFVSLLNARRYLEAGFCLSPAFGGSARAVGATLRAVQLVAAVPAEPLSAGRKVLRVTLRVRPRLALWNEGLNVRFVTLSRAAGGVWRLGSIDTGP
jgi:hypothetical protein